MLALIGVELKIETTNKLKNVNIGKWDLIPRQKAKQFIETQTS